MKQFTTEKRKMSRFTCKHGCNTVVFIEPFERLPQCETHGDSLEWQGNELREVVVLCEDTDTSLVPVK